MSISSNLLLLTRAWSLTRMTTQVIVFILLINLLIAIITNTYQRIVDNSDVIWFVGQV